MGHSSVLKMICTILCVVFVPMAWCGGYSYGDDRSTTAAPKVTVRKDHKGALEEATYKHKGTTIKAVVKAEKTKEGKRGLLVFTEGPDVFLTIQADIVRRPPEKGVLMRSSLTAKGRGVDYRMHMEVLATKPDQAAVTVSTGDVTKKGVFDFNTWTFKDKSKMPGFEDSLPAEIRAKLQPFDASFAADVTHYRTTSKHMFSAKLGVPPTMPDDVRPPLPSKTASRSWLAAFGIA